MAEQSVQSRVASLRETIRHHDYLYYVLDAPQISDSEYDALFKELQALEHRYPELDDPASPTKRVGQKPSAAFAHREHSLPMASLDNVFSLEEFQTSVQRLERLLPGEEITFWVDPKMDGLAVEVIFEAGRYVAACTRGDGRVGEDVTAQMRTVRTVPLQLREEGVEVPDYMRSQHAQGVVTVGSFPAGASRDGVMDMAGNVAEWCSDWYQMYGEGARTDPLESRESHSRVIRGGSWGYYGHSQRAADREFNSQVYPGYIFVGFRVAVPEAGWEKANSN